MLKKKLFFLSDKIQLIKNGLKFHNGGENFIFYFLIYDSKFFKNFYTHHYSLAFNAKI